MGREEGGYVYEPPGETHTLVVPEDVDEMITFFQVNGLMLYVDPDGERPSATRTSSPRSTCAASTTTRVGLARSTWTGSSSRADVWCVHPPA